MYVPKQLDLSHWPELWRLETANPTDPTAPNAAGRVDPKVLFAAGVRVRSLDPSGYDYPNRTKKIPWSPPVGGNNDARLQAIRDQEDYQYADIVVVMSFVAKFYEEHIHAAGDEVRYIIDGSGYFGEWATGTLPLCAHESEEWWARVCNFMGMVVVCECMHVAFP